MEKELLNLIPNARDWMGIRASGKNNYGVAKEEENKLELRLGPPGGGDCCDKKMAKCANIGAKRGFLASAECTTQNFQQQQQEKQRGFVEQQSIERKKVRSFEAVVGANKSLQTSARDTPAEPVVGWPPVRPSYRKNIASTSKAPVVSQKTSLDTNTKQDDTKKNLLVKIYMDGIPIGRKVDLKAYDNYEKLCLAVDELFRGLLEVSAQACPLATGTRKVEEKQAITGLLDGSGEYTLVYEDEEGDKMLVGDVPWNMFVSTAKRLRVLKTSELSSATLGTSSTKLTVNGR